jgi:XTP/dITP diphosphohydrolase
VTEPLLLATRSEGKLRELRPLFAAESMNVIDLAAAGIARTAEEDALEQFETFEENALAKAHYFLARSGLATLADDSGLEIASLGGLPGVRSKRWSGRTDLEGQPLDDANNAALLAALAPKADRSARYVCAAAYADWEFGVAVRGESLGRMLDEGRGAKGFGYDPFFLSDELGVTFGEASRERKEAISHRGRAFRSLLNVLKSRANRARAR